jgi:hypothetical protein
MGGFDWAIFLGIATGLGLPGVAGLVFIVRMENRVTVVESALKESGDWRSGVSNKLDSIARDLNRLIGEHQMEEHWGK